MKPTILNVAFPFAPVREDTAGGAEQVLSALDSAIVKHGWNSVVIASSGSIVKGNLIHGPEISELIDARVSNSVRHEYKNILQNSLLERHIDLIHLHGIDFTEYLPITDIPILVTLHLPISWYESSAFVKRQGVYFNCVSEYQRSTCPLIEGLLETIENGVDLPENPPRKKRARFLMSLGRICPEKGYHMAVNASRKVGIPFLLAGTVFQYSSHRQYFTEQIAPALDGRKYRYLGKIGMKRKKKLLNSSMGLLVPSVADETSSLAAMEAMAHGTPVIAFRNGALPRIVEHGVTGYIVGNELEMIDAIGKLENIDPLACYERVKERYTIKRMTSSYLKMYMEIMGKS